MQGYPTHGRRPPLKLLTAAVLALALAAPVWTASATTFNIEGVSQPVSPPTATFDGREYVALGPLAAAAGGDVTGRGFQATVRIGDNTARLRTGDTEVTSPRGWFTLRRKLEVQGGRAYIAVEDVAPFFRRAFAMDVRAVDHAAAIQAEAPTDADPELAPLRVDETGPGADEPELHEQELRDLEFDEPSPDLPRLFEERPPEPERPFTIVLDPGHGGSDYGGVGPSGLSEKEAVLAVAHEVRARLEDTPGVRVVLTRDDDHSVSTGERQRIAQRENANLVISIHAGALNSSQARGHAVYYHQADGAGQSEPVRRGSAALRAQQRTQAAQSQILGETIAGALANATGEAAPEVRGLPCRLLAGLTIPSVLIELGNINSAEGEAMLGAEDFRAEAASAIAAGAEDFRGQ